jgi:Mn-dependent DtxR family transcriptional regulator
MIYDLTILRAIARLSRAGKTINAQELNVRCGGEPAEIRQAIRRLESLGLVARTHNRDARLTLAGLAVAVAAARGRVAQNRFRLRFEGAPAVPAARARARGVAA